MKNWVERQFRKFRKRRRLENTANVMKKFGAEKWKAALDDPPLLRNWIGSNDLYRRRNDEYRARKDEPARIMHQLHSKTLVDDPGIKRFKTYQTVGSGDVTYIMPQL